MESIVIGIAVLVALVVVFWVCDQVARGWRKTAPVRRAVGGVAMGGLDLLNAGAESMYRASAVLDDASEKWMEETLKENRRRHEKRLAEIEGRSR